MFAGLGAARIRRLFKEARENAPAIIFIDELDAVGAHRGSDVSGERDQTLNQLLVEMDGFDGRDDVVVMAASNMLEKLDKALLRPGRFDRQVFVPPPDMRGRRRILDVHTRGKPLGQDVDLDRVARHAAGLTGADLANLANEAAILAGRKKREFIIQADFENAFERVVAGLQSRKVITDQEKRVVAWHEAGHALVSELLPTVDKVQKVSIVPRGKALGYTLNLPQEDRYLKSRQELIDYMKVLLAGRVSEQITFGRITTGAADDLNRVTAIARSMVHEYAMGTPIRAHQVPADDSRACPRRSARPATRRSRRSSRGGLSRRHRAAGRPPRPARRDRRAAADQRGHRARGDPRDHGRVTATAPAPRRPEDPRHARPRTPAEALASEPTTARPIRGPLRRVDSAPDVRADRSRGRRRRRPRRRRSRSTRAPSGCRSPTARRSTSRVSRPCCWTSADATSSSCARSAPTPRSASSWSARARACTTSPTGSTTSRRRWRSSSARGSS